MNTEIQVVVGPKEHFHGGNSESATMSCSAPLAQEVNVNFR